MVSNSLFPSLVKGSNKSICAPSVFFPLYLAIAPLSTGKSLNRELSAVCSTLSVSPFEISIGIPAWLTGQSIGLGIVWKVVNRYLELVPLF